MKRSTERPKRNTTNRTITSDPNPQPEPLPDQLIGDSSVRRLIGNVSRFTRWRWQRDRGFPQPIRMGGYRPLWSEREVQTWIREQLAARPR